MDTSKVGVLFLRAMLYYLAICFSGVDSQIALFQTVEALQSLWAAWNKSTPNIEANLAGWFTSSNPNDNKIYPCYNAANNWRGVTCLRYARYDPTDTQYPWKFDTWVVGLTLSDSYLEGILPSEIVLISKLVILSLTGNPGLTGSLPTNISGLPLNILDLHDNGFNGSIPSEFSQLTNLLQLDLSGNQFTGNFPTQFGSTETLQLFKISRNQLQGIISPGSFENMTQLQTLDLSGNKFTGSAPNVSGPKSLDYLNISYNYFTGLPNLSNLFDNWLPRTLRTLDVSGLNISGSLPEWNTSGLLSLEELYLDNNKLNGTLNLRSLQANLITLSETGSASKGLQVLSLQNNSIHDVLYDPALITQGQTKILLQGNPYCLEGPEDDGKRCYCKQYCAISNSPSIKSYWKVVVITTTICAFVLGSVILGLVSLLHQKNKHVHILLKKFEESEINAKRFGYTEIRTATKNFASERKLGQGAYGAVYKGILSNNMDVAVKQLFLKTEQAGEDFLNEVVLITNLQHRNLVALKGYCLHGKEMLLVYDYVDFCDLDKLLFSGTTDGRIRHIVDWPARFNICLGVAHGLHYLHASSQTRIIHRDIKASNILLDKNLNPKIADFGLARPIDDDKSEIMTQQRAGTLGYLAPEYMLYGQLSDKADVYSFGVLLLEIVSGERNKDPLRAEDEVYLPNRAWNLHKEGRLLELLDSRLHHVLLIDEKMMEVRRVLEVAILCVQTSPEYRPTMFRVVAMLTGESNFVVPGEDASKSGWSQSEIPVHHLGIHPEDPLLDNASSSKSDVGGPCTYGNATLEMSALHAR